MRLIRPHKVTFKTLIVDSERRIGLGFKAKDIGLHSASGFP